MVRKSLTKRHFSRNLKAIGMQALRIPVGSAPQAKEAGKYKGPGAEVFL